MGTEVESPNSNHRVSQLIADSFLFLEGDTGGAGGGANGNTPTTGTPGSATTPGGLVSANGNTDADTITNRISDTAQSELDPAFGSRCDVEKPQSVTLGQFKVEAVDDVLRPHIGAEAGCQGVCNDSISNGGTKGHVESPVDSSKSEDRMEEKRGKGEEGSMSQTQNELLNPSRTEPKDSKELVGVSIRDKSTACDNTTFVECKYDELSEPKMKNSEKQWNTLPNSQDTCKKAAVCLRKHKPDMGSSKGEEAYEVRLREQARVIVGKVLNYNSLREALRNSRAWCKNRRLWQWRDPDSSHSNSLSSGRPAGHVASAKLRFSDPQTYEKGCDRGLNVKGCRDSAPCTTSLEGIQNLTLSDNSTTDQSNSSNLDINPNDLMNQKTLETRDAKSKRSRFVVYQAAEVSPPELADDESPEATCTVAASAAVKLRRKRSEVGSRPCERKVSCDSAGGKPADKRVSCDSASSSPGQSPSAVRRHVLRSPVLRIKQEWNSVDITTSDSDSPRQSEDSDDDDDGGIYAESYRQSQWLYLGGSLGACSTDNLDAEADNLDPEEVRTSTSSSVFDGTQDASLGDTDVMDDVIADDDAGVTSQKETLNASVDSGLGQSECSPRLYKQRVLHDDLPPTLPRRPRHHRSESISTTASEIEFRKRYQAKTKRIVQRKSSTQTYQRMSERFYDEERVAVIEKEEGDPTFGFHIKGQRPVMVSTVETGSPAEQAGVRVGDAVIAVNDVNVMEVSHQEAIRLISFDTSRVKLTLATDNRVLSDMPLCSGFLIKQGGSGILKNWRRRWFILKQDHCLYYYKTEEDKDPLGAIMLTNYTITKAPEANRKYSFKAHKYGQRTYYLQAESEDDMNKWASALSNAAKATTKTDTWLDVSSHNVGLPALSIKGPDCHGHLTKMGNRRKNWKRRYCVLKDACLYYYIDLTSSTAQGVAHLHGYTVEDTLPFNRKFGFTLIPPDPNMRTFYFSADHETDMKRWIKALRKSIGRWVREEDY